MIQVRLSCIEALNRQINTVPELDHNGQLTVRHLRPVCSSRRTGLQENLLCYLGYQFNLHLYLHSRLLKHFC